MSYKNLTYFLLFNFSLTSYVSGTALPSPSIEIRNQQDQLLSGNTPQKKEHDYINESHINMAFNSIPDEYPCILIGEIKFITQPNISIDKLIPTTLNNTLQLNRCIGIKGLGIIVESINNILIGNGYITSSSKVEFYDNEKKQLAVKINFGLIEKYRIQTETKKSIWNIFPVEHGNILNVRNLEQGLDNLQNITNANAEFTIQPGQEQNSSQIHIKYMPADMLTTSVNMNNFGSKQTGKYQSSILFQLNSPTGLSDSLSLSINKDAGNKNPGNRGHGGWGLQYAIPWHYWQFGGLFNSRRYEQEIEGYSQKYLYHGKSEISELYANHTLFRSSNTKTNIQLKAYNQRSQNFIDDTEILVQRRSSSGWEWQLQYQQLLPKHVLNGSITYRRGTGAFKALPAPEERFNEGSARMEMYKADFQWETHFLTLNRIFKNRFSINGQWSPEPLTSQDRFCLGGSNSIKAFYGKNAQCGDNGTHLQNEISTSVAGYETYLGVDWGKLGGASVAPEDNEQVSGIYLGIKGRVGKYLSFNTFTGKPIKHDKRVSIPKNVLGFSTTALY